MKNEEVMVALLREVVSGPGKHFNGCSRARHFTAAGHSMANVKILGPRGVGKVRYEKILAEHKAAALETAPACDCLKGRINAFLETV
jgi:hypothetical protein